MGGPSENKRPGIAGENVRPVGRTSGTGPIAQGVPIADLADGGKFMGHTGGEQVLLVRSGNEVFAVGPHCTHYHGPLAEGLVSGEAIRCPWHHACFSLRTGEAERSPAFFPIDTWTVEARDGKAFVSGKRAQARPKPRRGGRP